MQKLGGFFAAFVVVGLLLSPAAQAQNPATAEDIAALRRELRVLAERDQRQIDALERQVRSLSAALARRSAAPVNVAAPTYPAPPANAAAPEKPPAPAVVAGAAPAPTVPEPPLPPLPGRSVVPPYTGTGPGTPGPSLTTPAAPISSGGDHVILSLSGQIDRALLYGNDGHDSKVRNVDNGNSSTRFRFVGEARPFAGAVAGINLETEIKPNSSATETLTQNISQPATASPFTIRQAEVYGGHPDFGEVRLGFGSAASYLTAETDLSGTAVVTYEAVADFDGGFAFRQKGTATVPGGIRGAFVLSPADSYGPAVGSVFNFFDGLVRDDRIRYDSPVLEGFQFATSVLDGGAFDFATRYAREYDDFRIAGGLGLAFAKIRSHTQPGSYGYAGVPAGAGGISLAGTNSAPGAPTVADDSANGSDQLDGSVSVLLKNGLNFTVAGGVRDPRYHDPTGRSLRPDLVYTKLGYQHRFLDIGLTAFSVDFAQNDELIFAGDRARAYGIAAVQNIDRFGTELFLGGRYETLDRSFGQYRPIVAVMSGARVRF